MKTRTTLQNSSPFAPERDRGGGLLEELRKKLFCMYLSDLRFGLKNELARKQLAQNNLKRFSLSELEDAAFYLFGEERHFADYREASIFFRDGDQRKTQVEK